MNDSAPDVWFFSREGQQSGPITFADLKAKADEGLLRPRHDLVWREGLPEWCPVGEIEGLFERKIVPVVAPLAPPPYSPVASQEVDFYTGWPGAARLPYLLAVVLLPLLWSFLSPLLMSLLGGFQDPAALALGARWVPVLLGIISVWYGLQRFANLGMSRWWFLGNFVPGLNLWLGYRSFACPAGYAIHKKMDGIGIVLAIVYWLVVLLALVLLAAIVAVLLGGIGEPGLQEKVRNAVEEFQGHAEPKSR